MKHIKTYKLFESNREDELEVAELKDIFQELADEWDIYWLDKIDWAEVMSGGIDENNFVYSILKVDRENYYTTIHPYNFLVDIILPENRENPVWKNFDKFISDVENIEQRLRSMGYENVTHHQFDDNEDEKRHFQVRI